MKKPVNEKREWHLIDLNGQILGRAATKISTILIGKHKPTYSTNLDFGDYVVAINSAKIKLTGNKLEQKQYFKHSGYIGNLKTKSVSELLVKTPNEVIKRAVKGMLPKNKLRDERLKRFKIYADASHPHQNIKTHKVE